MAFRFFPIGTQFFTNDGKVLADGSLSFFDSGTTDPRATYSDPELTTPNSQPVELDGAGRPNTDIWGDGSYRVVLKDSLGATIATLDDVSGPQGIPDPSLQSGLFLTNDGTDLFWAPILQVPDPDGETPGYVLTTDGANYQWDALPEPPTPEATPTVEIGATTLEIGSAAGGERILFQTGTATAPASGSQSATINVTFDPQFKTLIFATAQAQTFNPSAADSSGFSPVVTIPNSSNSGMTINVNTNGWGHGGNRNLINTTQLWWMAIGLVDPPPEE